MGYLQLSVSWDLEHHEALSCMLFSDMMHALGLPVVSLLSCLWYVGELGVTHPLGDRDQCGIPISR